jgi:hypothetical protein
MPLAGFCWFTPSVGFTKHFLLCQRCFRFDADSAQKAFTASTVLRTSTPRVSISPWAEISRHKIGPRCFSTLPTSLAAQRADDAAPAAHRTRRRPTSPPARLAVLGICGHVLSQRSPMVEHPPRKETGVSLLALPSIDAVGDGGNYSDLSTDITPACGNFHWSPGGVGHCNTTTASGARPSTSTGHPAALAIATLENFASESQKSGSLRQNFPRLDFCVKARSSCESATALATCPAGGPGRQ